MQFEVTILGSNGAIPAYNRHPSAQIVTYNGHNFLIDCDGYKQSVIICDQLLEELLAFENNTTD